MCHQDISYVGNEEEMVTFESMDSKVCQENCDKKAAAAKKECGDDKACHEKVMNGYKKCSAGCKVSI